MLGSRNIEVVLINDSPEFLSIIGNADSLKKYQLTSFSNSNQAVDYLLGSNNNGKLVIIFDHQPSFDGFEIINKTKELGCKYPFLFISQIDSISNALKAIQAGAMDYLVISKELETELPKIVEKKIQDFASISSLVDDSSKDEKKRLEKVLQARLRISVFALTHSLNELIQNIIDEAELLTKSNIGFFHFLDNDQKTLILQTWSTNTLINMCASEGQGTYCNVEQAGIWAECIKHQKPIIHNNNKDLINRNHLPKGHPKVVRELVVPLFEGEYIVAILGVGNKESDYNNADIDIINQLLYFAWDIVKSKRAEEDLKRSEGILIQIADNLPVFISIVNNNLEYTFVNREYENFFKINKSAIIGKKVKDIIGKEAFERAYPNIVKALAGQSLTFNNHITNKDGIKRTIQTTYKPYYQNNIINGLIILVIDITEQRRAEESLRESEQLYHSMFDKTQAIKLLIDPTEGIIIDANQAAVQFYGYSLEQLKSLKISDINTLSASQVKLEMADARQEKRTYFNFRHKLASGEIRDVEVYSSPIKIGGHTLLHSIIHDITDRKIAETKLVDSATQWQTTFDTVQEGICLIDNNQQIVRCNKVMYEQFPNSGDNMIGKKCWEVIHQTTALLPECPIIKMKKTLQRESVEQKIGDRWFDITVDPIFDSNKNCTGSIHIIRNITERKQAEESLVQLNKQLKAINSTKDRLFSIIAHDLKSPFNSILGFSDLLIANLGNYSNEKVGEFIEQINFSAKNTLTLIENLLAWANTQMGQIEYKPENLALQPIIQEVIELLSSTAKIKNITIKYFQSENFAVFADKNMLQIIMRNLISNAIKFSSTNGKIIIYSILDHNQVEITVSDNGTGIREDVLKKIFVNNCGITTRGTANEKGSGLGLILCKEFVVKQGGRIWVESEVGVGSEFKFTLPKA